MKQSTLQPYYMTFFRILPSQLLMHRCHMIADLAHPVTHGPICAMLSTNHKPPFLLSEGPSTLSHSLLNAASKPTFLLVKDLI